jgi:ADP-ribose pyrophosphatase YjhB (NUDIX family)
MKLFINDKPVKIISLHEAINKEKFNARFSGKEEIISKKLIGHVLIEDACSAHVERLFKLLDIKKLKKLNSVTLAVKDKETIIAFIKDQFKIVKAAGGLVKKNDKVLLIYRLGKWDLPKGKLKKGEDPVKGAKREVEEECNVKVVVMDKLCCTWHTYIRKGKRVLKKTNWYTMECIDDVDMQPQKEEDIEEVKWMEKKDVRKSLRNSYKSIEKVFERFYKGTDF